MIVRRLTVGAMALLILGMTHVARAQGTEWHQEYANRIKSTQNVSPLGDGMFGENINLFNGTVTYSATDVSLPGNNALPVQLSRSFNPLDQSSERLLGDWDIDAPYIGGTFPTVFSSQGYWAPTTRCSTVNAPPPAIVSGYSVLSRDYWGGTQLSANGAGGDLLKITTDTRLVKPSPSAPYKWTSKGQWFFSCITTPLKSGHPGEGFVGHAPDGTKYTFDYMVIRPYNGISKKDPSKLYGVMIDRKSARLYATKVEDRFGNWVQYDWTGGRLNRIWSSDGREILLAYTGGHLSSVRVPVSTGPDRVWSYQVVSYALTSVTNPDGSTWQFARSGDPQFMEYVPDASTPNDPFDFVRDDQNYCWPTHQIVPKTSRYHVTHPSGATAQFTFSPTRHGRTNVIFQCLDGVDDNWRTDYNQHALTHDVFSIQNKVVTGPGLTALTTYYAYSGLDAGYRPSNPQNDLINGATAPPHYKYVTVTDPDGRQHTHRFGKDYELNEGQLFAVETRKNGVLHRTVANSYVTEAEIPSQPFPGTAGSNMVEFGDQFTAGALRPVRSVVTTYHLQGASFSSLHNTYDPHARAISTQKFSSLGHSKTDTTEYLDDLSLWLLGQVQRSLTNNVETSRTEFWLGSRLPKYTWRFGKLQSSLTYAVDGTLQTVADGKGNTITLSSWKRGIPQLIQYPATTDQPSGASQSAFVDDNGWLGWVTDENGHKTVYDYDPMGRAKRVDYPTGDTTAWNSTHSTFAKSATPAYGLPANHWRHTVTTGNATAVTYFDGLLRPVIKETYDAGNVAPTLSQSVTRYDAAGRVQFASYPQRSLNASVVVTWGDPAVSPNALGTRSEYDPLDRITAVRQDSELGVLSTLTEYLPGFETLVTTPKLTQTRTSYLAWDQPSTDLPLSIIYPENARTYIHRDGYGKPLWIKRYGALAGQPEVVRWYLYNSAQELCKTMEPETAATVMTYDAAGNLAWSATGQSLWSTTSCEDTLVPAGAKIHRSYDARNRLKTLSFPDGVGNQEWAYTPDGLPDVVTTYNAPSQGEPVVSAYHYNKRRMLDGQGDTVTQPGWYTWGIGYGYDANGNLARHVHPDGEVIQYNPNALGQATGASSTLATYASGAQYLPNGAIKQFTYGNGILHNMEPNDRQLPAATSDGTALHFVTTFDKNGNVTKIKDMIRGSGYDRDMTYDDLDRLLSAQSLAFGGTNGRHEFTYDVLDNLRSWKLAGVKDYATYEYNASSLLTNIRNTAGASIVGIGYDVRGNVSNRNGQQFSFGYDNRLRGALQSGSTTEAYRYDVHGRRVLSWSPVSGVLLSQYGQDGVLRYQSDFRTNKALTFVYLAGSQIATREEPFYTGNPVVKYHHTDSLGSPVATTDANQVIIQRSEYEPYGALINRPNDNRPGYTGHVMDAETGLTYMQQRYYDPQIGRFLSVDPVTANTTNGTNFNRYWYGNNNPYKFKDPDGRLGCTGTRIESSCSGGGMYDLDNIAKAENKSLQGTKGKDGSAEEKESVQTINKGIDRARARVDRAKNPALTGRWNATTWKWDPTNKEFVADGSLAGFVNPATPNTIFVGHKLASFANTGMKFTYHNASFFGGTIGLTFAVLHEFGHVWTAGQGVPGPDREMKANSFARSHLSPFDRDEIECSSCAP